MLDLRDYPELTAEFLARHPQDDPRFEPWLEAWYGSPTAIEWLDLGAIKDGLNGDRIAFSDFVIRSWSMGRALAERFSSEQVGRTISAVMGRLQWLSQPEEGERMMWDAVHALFFEVFEPLSSGSDDRSDLGKALFMFWDVAAWRPAQGTELGRTAFLRLIEKSLASDNVAMQRSALHGIGHHVHWDDGVRASQRIGLSSLALEFAGQACAELRTYAGQAARGMVA